MDVVQFAAILAEDGFEHLARLPVGLGLDADRLLVWQVDTEQDALLHADLLTAQTARVDRLVQRLAGGGGGVC